MARMKKATAKKAAPKKVSKRPAPKKQVPKEELAPVPTQQNPQPPMGTSPMGANGPMMRKGGKIKKMQGGGPVYETSPYTKAKQEKENKKTEYNKVTATMKKAQGGGPAKDTTKVPYETSPYTKVKQDNSNKPIEYKKFLLKYQQDEKSKIKSVKKAQGGSSFAKLAPPYDKATYADKIAGATKNKAKSGTSIKKAQFGGLLGGVGKKLLGGAMGKIGGMAGGKIGNMFGGGDSNSMKSGGSMKKKCKYGCK